eukprot:Gb_38632 [translate_table: standard]
MLFLVVLQGVCGADTFTSSSIGNAVQKIVAKEGPAALMRGLTPRMLFHAPAAAICWSTYEASFMDCFLATANLFFPSFNEIKGVLHELYQVPSLTGIEKELDAVEGASLASLYGFNLSSLISECLIEWLRHKTLTDSTKVQGIIFLLQITVIPITLGLCFEAATASGGIQSY